MWCLSNKKLLHHYIKVSLQKISSIYKLIQQILGSHDLNNHARFWVSPPRNHWNNFKFSWICTNMQKISSFHSWDTINFLVTRLTTPISDNAHSKVLWSTVNLCKFVSTCKKSRYFIDLFWRYGWLNPAIWLAENI